MPTRLKVIVALLVISAFASALSIIGVFHSGGILMIDDVLRLAFIPAAIALRNGRRSGRRLVVAWFCISLISACSVVFFGIQHPDGLTANVFGSIIEGPEAADYLMPVVLAYVGLSTVVVWQLFSQPVDEYIRRCEAERAATALPEPG